MIRQLARLTELRMLRFAPSERTDIHAQPSQARNAIRQSTIGLPERTLTGRRTVDRSAVHWQHSRVQSPLLASLPVPMFPALIFVFIPSTSSTAEATTALT